MKAKLRIALVLSLVFVLVFAAACELPGKATQQQPVVIVVTATPETSGGGNTMPTEPPPPPVVVTEPPVVVTEPPVVITEPPVQNTEFFTEDFSSGLDNYTAFQINEYGKLLNSISERAQVKTEDGKLKFKFDGNDIWWYAAYNKTDYDDVKVELEVENLGVNTQRVALLCRYSKDAGFYELDISGGGLWELYYYDNMMNKGYHLIANGASEFIKMKKATNVYALNCKGDKLTITINGNLVKTAKSSDLHSGQAGFGISSFDALPVIMNINWVKYSPAD